MKRYSEMRADQRPIEAKALGLIMAMDDAAALRLQRALASLAARDSERAKMFVPGQLRA